MTWLVGDIVELTRSCELGDMSERAVVTSVHGRDLMLVFPCRSQGRRVIWTCNDYKFMKRV